MALDTRPAAGEGRSAAAAASPLVVNRLRAADLADDVVRAEAGVRRTVGRGGVVDATAQHGERSVGVGEWAAQPGAVCRAADVTPLHGPDDLAVRSEEHTSELQSRQYLVCRLLLEKKKKKKRNNMIIYKKIK